MWGLVGGEDNRVGGIEEVIGSEGWSARWGLVGFGLCFMSAFGFATHRSIDVDDRELIETEPCERACLASKRVDSNRL